LVTGQKDKETVEKRKMWGSKTRQRYWPLGICFPEARNCQTSFTRATTSFLLQPFRENNLYS